MKLTKKIFSILCAGLIISVQLFAQDDKPKDELYLMHVDRVKIDKVSQYEENIKKEIDLWKKHGMELTVKFASKTDDNVYRYLTPIENYADIDKQNEYWKNFSDKAGEDVMKELYGNYNGMYHSHKNVIIKRLADLSYWPENTRLKGEDIKFIHIDHYYFKEAKIDEGMKLMKEFKDLMAEKKSDDPYNVWTSDIGDDMGWVAVVRYGKDNIDYYEETNKRMKTFAENFKEMWPKFSATLKHFTHENGTAKREFTYSPEK